MTYIRKAVTIALLLAVTALGLVRAASLSNAANSAPADECALFSCIFDASADDD